MTFIQDSGIVLNTGNKKSKEKDICVCIYIIFFVQGISKVRQRPTQVSRLGAKAIYLQYGRESLEK